ncbi:hypothetical protein FIV42_24470 [Persicimonas caeni]|uniref:Uncharacterized protein n=1 Tax=Persicimonas caeni TaxID=2292766 RepID=A0A4Y6PZM7_PERCE|nr:hypothetical protein [Persicimonas caeni]QDG53781.1 hypothetical protein FIV42_24470 [Persicimonas caeni]QED35002.1 hypothetical protein FRD00_24465 [Persicimonas caeni]
MNSTQLYVRVVLSTLALLGAPQAVSAQSDEPAAEPSVEPAIIHRPSATLRSNEQVLIETRIVGDWKLEQAWVDARPLGSQGEYRRFALKRTGDDEFAAILPKEMSVPPGIEYYIASRAQDDTERVHFASREEPYRLMVRPTAAEVTERHRLERYDNDRSQFRLRAEYTAYGRRNVGPGEVSIDASGEDLVTDANSDAYWVAELEYTYRVLTWLHDFRFGIGRLRGSQPTVTVDGESRGLNDGYGSDTPLGEPGYDYGYGEANLAFLDNLSVGTRLILGASDQGFAAGAGATVRIGRISGTHFAVGGEIQDEVGNRGWMAFRWDTVPDVPMALTIELTKRPDEGGPTGTRLLYDVGVEASEGLTLDARAGYASRSAGIEGGFVGGLGATYEF